MNSERKKYKTWRFEKQSGNITETQKVCECENGYIIEISKYGTPEGSDKYIDECKKYISTKNPLKDQTPEQEVSAPENIIKSLQKVFDNEY